MSDDLYHQEILDHYYHPDNFGKLDYADFTIEETNASCGDSFTFYVKTKQALPEDQALSEKNLLRGFQRQKPLESSDGDSLIIEDIKFSGTGCAISTAACSMLTGKLIGQPLSALKNLDLDYMQHLIGNEITPTRLKCLLLPARALSKISLD